MRATAPARLNGRRPLRATLAVAASKAGGRFLARRMLDVRERALDRVPARYRAGLEPAIANLHRLLDGRSS